MKLTKKRVNCTASGIQKSYVSTKSLAECAVRDEGESDSGMTQPTEINPGVLAQSVLALLTRSGRPRSEGLGRTMQVEQESGEAMTFNMLASGSLDAAQIPRVRIWLADRLVLDVELDRDNDNHVVHTFDDG